MTDVKTMEWREFINLFKIEDLMGRRTNAELKSDMLSKILFFNKDDTVKDAIEELTVTKVVSAPVYDDAENKFIGFIDMLDLACYCSDQFGPDLFQKERAEQVQEIERNLMQQPVSALIDKSGRNKWLTLDRKDPLARLFATLAHPDVHRVPIVDSDVTGPEKVLAIITEYEVVRWLWESRTFERFPSEILNLPVKDLLSGGSDLVLIPQDKTLLEAFKLMKDRRVSGLGVVNDAKELVGNLSASDMKVAAASATDLVHLLRMRLDNFLETKRTLMLNLNERMAPPRPITVSEDESFGSVLEKFVVNHIHRVWAVKPSQTAQGTGASTTQQQAGPNIPVGCISLTDVARVLSQHGLVH